MPRLFNFKLCAPPSLSLNEYLFVFWVSFLIHFHGVQLGLMSVCLSVSKYSQSLSPLPFLCPPACRVIRPFAHLLLCLSVQQISDCTSYFPSGSRSALPFKYFAVAARPSARPCYSSSASLSVCWFLCLSRSLSPFLFLFGIRLSFRLPVPFGDFLLLLRPSIKQLICTSVRCSVWSSVLLSITMSWILLIGFTISLLITFCSIDRVIEISHECTLL